MAIQWGKCTNYDQCDYARDNRIVEADTSNFKCPGCGRVLIPTQPPGSPPGKRFLTWGGALLGVLIVVGVGAWLWLMRVNPPPSAPSGMPPEASQLKSVPPGMPSALPQPKSVTVEQGLLGRPLRIGVVTWPGYAGGIVANNGFKPNKDSIFWKGHHLLVEIQLMEDVDVRAKAFANGGQDGVDIVWSTVDFWANELPGFLKGGVKARAIMQVDWSRGGDAIVADQSIQRIEDLKGKKISLALFTPSHWLLEYSLENSSLSEAEQAQIVKELVGKNASPDARADFVAGKVDAAVVWEPDVSEALQKRAGAHILHSSKDAPNLIADVMVVREDFIQQHPEVVKAFVQGWLEGTTEANRHPDRVVRLLMDNEPLYKDLGAEETRKELATVKWADLSDNTQMFGLDGSESLFDRLFKQASQVWVKRGYIAAMVPPAQAKDDSFLKPLYDPATIPRPALPSLPPPPSGALPPVMTKPVQIHFPSGGWTIDPNAEQLLDPVGLLAQTHSSSYIRITGNTDNTGNYARNKELSQKRAQAVVDYLVQRYGLNRSQFIAIGKGPDKPIATNDTPEGRAKNRRTDVEVVRREQ